MPEKLDLMKAWKPLYTAPHDEPVIVDVPPIEFLMIDGQGSPIGSQEFQQAMEGLYGVAYTLKFAARNGPLATDFRVMPSEALWWMEGGEFRPDRPEEWKWTLMIAQPEFITEEMVAVALEEVAKKKDLPVLARLRFETFHEGLSAQIMHVGPYARVAPTIEKLLAFIHDNGHAPRGKHHEIYLSDPRRAKPEKLKTLIRQGIGVSAAP